MKARPLFVFLPLLASVLACGYFGLPTLFSSGQTAQAADQSDEPQILNTPEVYPTETETPTPSPVPTLDYGDLPITQTSVAVQAAAAAAAATQVNAVTTMQALSIVSGQATATQSAIVVSTAAAQATANERARLDATPAYATAVALERQIVADEKTRDAEALSGYVLRVGGVVIGLLAAALFLLIVYYKIQLAAHQRALAQQNYDGVSLLENLSEPTQVSTSANENFEHPSYVKASEKAVLRQAALDLGGRFSHRAMTPKYFTDPRWREIREILLTRSANGVQYAELNPDGSISLTDAGWQWLGVRPPSSPSVEISPEESTSLDATHHTTPHPAGEVVENSGGGVGEEVENE